jgi:hypothetical protein
MRTLYALGAVVGIGMAAAAVSPNAHAADWSVGFTVGGPGYVVVAPPQYYAPPPTRYYVPPSYEYGPGYYYAPPRYYIPHRERHEDGYHWREWHHHHHHDDDDD